ncbi:SH3 domain-containing protein [Eubacteriales bacterium OttesenSCG-928-A19]|nr:SH3 domain-containing protein [Eubacteriales bacterium OttesenSCG-928-A19]
MRTTKRTLAFWLALILCLLAAGGLTGAAYADDEGDIYFTSLSPGPTQIAYIGNCKSFVNLRDGPSTEEDIIGELTLGTQISLLQWNRAGDWCKILYDNDRRAGWVFGEFIVLEYPMASRKGNG